MSDYRCVQPVGGGRCRNASTEDSCYCWKHEEEGIKDKYDEDEDEAWEYLFSRQPIPPRTAESERGWKSL